MLAPTVGSTEETRGSGHEDHVSVENERSHPLQQASSRPPEDGAVEEQSPEGAAAAAADANSRDKHDQQQQQPQDDDDVTVIVLDHSPEDALGQRLTIAWTGEAGPQVEERRRNIMLRELQRVQRTSFLHFLILCLIPTVLLFIVIATVISEDEECYSEATICHQEPRSFINAFTTRCICEAIAVPRSG